MLKILQKILIVLLLAIIFISNALNIVKAAFEVSSLEIKNMGKAPYHLKYYKSEEEDSTYVECDMVGYKEGEDFYPAYCLNRDADGVGKVDDYNVNVENIDNYFLDNVVQKEEVWRAVKNGYPYKTGSEMGLDSDIDAFVVTKLAVYCLTGQADVNLYSADEEDEIGQAMLKKLQELVEIGQNGKETFNNEITINKSGDFVEDGGYYSYKYKVTSGSAISEYSIGSITGLQEGDLITDEEGNIKNTFSSGENFKIKILKEHLNSNKDISFEIEAKLTNYPMFYGKTTIEGTQNYLLTASKYQNIKKTEKLNLKLDTGKIIVEKQDDETSVGIPNTTFELYNLENKLISTLTTDEEGKIEFPNLFQGTYKLKEVKSNDNYILNENAEYTVQVEFNKTSTIKIENEHKKGDLIIYKVDKENNKLTLGNVEFELYSKETGDLIGKYYTDADGKIEIKGLRTGEYLLKETNTNEWYNLAENKDIEIKWNETAEITVEDELKKGQIKVVKVDKENHQIKIPNVEFEVLDVNDNVLETISTDENGEAYTKEYVIRDYEKLRLRETKTNELYELDNTIIELPLEENKTKEVIIENEKIKGNIKIIKTASDSSEYVNIEKGQALDGVKFEIYDVNNNLVDTIITDKEGIAVSKDLEKGIYKVKEVETKEWFILDEKDYTVEINKNGQEETLNLENTPAKPDLEVEKTGPDETEAGKEITYEISVKNSGNVPLDNFIWEDVIPTDYIRVTKIMLGTYNQKNSYDLYYKTNLSQDYILLLEDLSTLKAEEIDLSKELKDDEYITNIKLDFGTVDFGFQNNDKTLLYANVKQDAKRDELFENKVILSGNYKGKSLSKDSSCKTKIYEYLPLTGM